MGGTTLGGPTMGNTITLTARATVLRGAVDGTNGNHNFTLINTSGIILFNNITLGMGDLTLDNSAAVSSSEISIRNEDNAPPVEIILSAGNITLAVAAELQPDMNIGNSLSVRALENITITRTSGSVGFRNFAGLELRADDDFDGMGTIINGGAAINIFSLSEMQPTNLLLRQAGAFPADLLTDLSTTRGGRADLRITGENITQIVHPWMDLDASTFVLRGHRVILAGITTGTTALDFGSTTLDWRADNITLGARLTAASIAFAPTPSPATAPFSSPLKPPQAISPPPISSAPASPAPAAPRSRPA